MIQSGYTKLFGSIVASTIWREDDKTRIVWITLLALSDKDGYVATSIPGLADLARVSVAECEAALEKLQQPDKYSRSPEHDGRRIEVVEEGGWFILNRAKYRDSCGEQGKLERHREANRRYYERRKQQPSDTDSDNSDIRTDYTGCVGDKKEKEKEKENIKPLSSASASDGRFPNKPRRKLNPKHTLVRELIQKEWVQRNQKTCPWGPAAARQLATLLSETPDWTVEDYNRCISNRFASDGVAMSEDPKVFISHLPKYLSGPLNQYGHQKDRVTAVKPHVEYQDPALVAERQLQQ